MNYKKMFTSADPTLEEILWTVIRSVINEITADDIATNNTPMIMFRWITPRLEAMQNNFPCICHDQFQNHVKTGSNGSFESHYVMYYNSTHEVWLNTKPKDLEKNISLSASRIERTSPPTTIRIQKPVAFALIYDTSVAEPKEKFNEDKQAIDEANGLLKKDFDAALNYVREQSGILIEERRRNYQDQKNKS